MTYLYQNFELSVSLLAVLLSNQKVSEGAAVGLGKIYFTFQRSWAKNYSAFETYPFGLYERCIYILILLRLFHAVYLFFFFWMWTYLWLTVHLGLVIKKNQVFIQRRESNLCWLYFRRPHFLGLLLWKEHI